MEQTYRVNEIFYTLQGEGHHTGCAAVFVRFSGCNLSCPFCDTDFSAYRELTAAQIVDAMLAFPARFAVLTGGEPTLQVTEDLIDEMHRAGFTVAMETNGTRPLPANLDWSTVSPKGEVAVSRCSELKVLFGAGGQMRPMVLPKTEADYYYIQPCDVGDDEQNRRILQACVEYVKAHPRWRLSLQTHKMAGFK